MNNVSKSPFCQRKKMSNPRIILFVNLFHFFASFSSHTQCNSVINCLIIQIFSVIKNVFFDHDSAETFYNVNVRLHALASCFPCNNSNWIMCYGLFYLLSNKSIKYINYIKYTLLALGIISHKISPRGTSCHKIQTNTHTRSINKQLKAC